MLVHGEEVVAAVGCRADDDGVLFIELGEGGVNPAGGDVDTVGADDGDLFVTFVEALGEGACEAVAEITLALRLEVDLGFVEDESGVIDDVREDPEADRFVGVIGRVAETEVTVFQTVELSEEDMNEGLIDTRGIFLSHGGSDPGFDFAREGLFQKDHEEARWHVGEGFGG